MNHAGCVRRSHALPGRREYLDNPPPRWLRAFLPVVQRLAVNELHRDEHVLADRSHVVHGDDVRMAHACERLSFTQEPRGRIALTSLHELDRDAAVELRIVSGVDHTHAAGAERIDDDIASDERAASQLCRLR